MANGHVGSILTGSRPRNQELSVSDNNNEGHMAPETLVKVKGYNHPAEQPGVP